MAHDFESYIPNSILKCKRDQEFQNFFLSLVDYRNNYFLSNDPEDIIHFYEGFENREELIEWMKERPKGSCEIREVEGEKEIVVVIPTADLEGEYAKRCREEIFKGLHIIFVVSGKDNNYFNYAHNCNVGIKRALEYNPKWVVLSNDDMYKIDHIEILKKELGKLDNEKVDVAFPTRGDYYSILSYFGKKTWQYKLYRHISDWNLARLYVKFKIDYFYAFYNFKSKIVFKKVLDTDFINIDSFGIFSSNYLKKFENIFDDTYINDHEDTDLSFRLRLEYASRLFIGYSIGAFRGGTFGMDRARGLRSVAGRAYFNYKYSALLEDFLKRR